MESTFVFFCLFVLFCFFLESTFGEDAMKVVLETIQKRTQAKSLAMNDLTAKAEKLLQNKEGVVMKLVKTQNSDTAAF